MSPNDTLAAAAIQAADNVMSRLGYHHEPRWTDEQLEAILHHLQAAERVVMQSHGADPWLGDLLADLEPQRMA